MKKQRVTINYGYPFKITNRKFYLKKLLKHNTKNIFVMLALRFKRINFSNIFHLSLPFVLTGFDATI